MEDAMITNAPVFQLGKIRADRYWLECLDGRMLQIDADTKDVLVKLANEESTFSISEELGFEEEEIEMLVAMIGMEVGDRFSIIDHTTEKGTISTDNDEKVSFYNPWLDQRWFSIGMSLVLILSIGMIGWFVTSTPFYFVEGIKEQWLIAVFLTVSVLIHEVGHLLTMPRNENMSIDVQWSGPIPLLSITCNEAWKLPKWKRMRINGAGFVADLVVFAVAITIGFIAPSLLPWIGTFLFIHIIRMVFALCPFLPGDGYWMLVDLFDYPNLWADGQEQLKQRKISWPSLYALLRILFLGAIWVLYAFVIYLWTTSLAASSWEEILYFVLHPAPLLILLNIGYMVFSLGRITLFKMKKAV